MLVPQAFSPPAGHDVTQPHCAVFHVGWKQGLSTGHVRSSHGARSSKMMHKINNMKGTTVIKTQNSTMFLNKINGREGTWFNNKGRLLDY